MMEKKITKFQKVKQKILGVDKEKQSEVGWIHVRERNGKHMINVLEILDELKDISNQLNELKNKNEKSKFSTYYSTLWKEGKEN